MLDFNDPYGLMHEDLEAAVLVAAQVELIRVARESGLSLEQGSYDEYTQKILRVIDDPVQRIPPERLIEQATKFAEAGAHRMIRTNDTNFHEDTWAELSIWPFT